MVSVHLRALRARIAGGELGEINQLACNQWDEEPPTARFRAPQRQRRRLRGGPRRGGDPGRAVGGTAAIVTLGRRFPHADSCWLEMWGTAGYERVPFMWDAAVWEGDRDDVFLGAMIAQAEAFARALRGEPHEGAGGKDAVAALSVAERVTDVLARVAVDH